MARPWHALGRCAGTAPAVIAADLADPLFGVPFTMNVESYGAETAWLIELGAWPGHGVSAQGQRRSSAHGAMPRSTFGD